MLSPRPALTSTFSTDYSAPEVDAKVLPDALLSSVPVCSSRLRRQVEEEKSIETAVIEMEAVPSSVAEIGSDTESIVEETTTMDARSDKFLVRPVDDGLLGQRPTRIGRNSS